jgi:hypothetical protein
MIRNLSLAREVFLKWRAAVEGTLTTVLQPTSCIYKIYRIFVIEDLLT